MRSLIVLAGLAAGVVALSPQAEAACNVRGEFCGYPAWAANAFTHPRDRVPNAWLQHPVRESYHVRNSHRVKKRHRRAYRR
jgi:hypothetical protein